MPKHPHFGSQTEATPKNIPTFLPPEDAELVVDWTRLVSGDTVVLVEASNQWASGVVDALTPNGEILWLSLDQGFGRRLFGWAGDTRLWRTSVSKPWDPDGPRHQVEPNS